MKDWINELPLLQLLVWGIDDTLPSEAVIILENSEIGERFNINRRYIDENNMVQILKAPYEVIDIDEPHIYREDLTGFPTYVRFCRIKKIGVPTDR